MRFLAAVAAVLGVLGIVVALRHEVRASEERLHALRAEAARLAESVRVLRAEWSHANRPEALAALAARRLGLLPSPVMGPEAVQLLPRRLPVPPAGGKES